MTSPETSGWSGGLGLPPEEYAIQAGPVWEQATHLQTSAGLPTQGWKLHVSARPSTSLRTLELAVPVLRAHRVTFKVAASETVLHAINDGAHGPAAIGKFITVYPDPGAVVEVAGDLAIALGGLSGPRIRSDRQVREDAPVYYRYGPFAPQLARTASGELTLAVMAPDGQALPGFAQEHFVDVPWAPDPFRGGASPAGDAGHRPVVLGDHYQVASVISRNPRGATYRGTDLRDGRAVVVKHARAFVNESATGDARSYLRAERRVLTHLAGQAAVPEVLDHFRAGADEYLVLSDLGGVDLRFDVLANGLYSADAPRGIATVADAGDEDAPARPRDAWTLARGLLGHIDAIHAAGIVIRDLAPKNVLVLADGQYGLVDFELAAHAGAHQFGWSPGYSSDRQRRNEHPEPADDLYSLGATLFHALTGMDPFVHAADGSADLRATLECLADVAGAVSDGTRLVTLLLSEDVLDRRAAAEMLRGGRPPGAARPAARRAAPPVDQALARILALAEQRAKRLVAGMGREPIALNAQSGVAGLLAELAFHAHARDVTLALAWAGTEPEGVSGLTHGLMFGRTGVAVALHLVADAAGDPRLLDRARALLPRVDELPGVERLEVANGLGGVLLGALSIGDADLAGAVAATLATHEPDWPGQAAALPVNQPGHAISIADGFAHGSAGITFARLQAELAGVGTPSDGTTARLSGLAQTAGRLATEAGRPTARPMAASWCQGLAGVGAVLVRGAAATGDDRLLDAAIRCAEAAHPIALRSPSLSECCGVAGVGELELDLYLATGDDRQLVRAQRLLHLTMRRGELLTSGYVGGAGPDGPFGWGDGLAGLLAFARRVADPTTPRHWMGPPVRAALPTRRA